MLTFQPADNTQYDAFLELTREQTDTDYERVLAVMGLSWEEYTQLFRERGQVTGIYRDGELAGYYWIEQREDVLHLHGLILKEAFQRQGIGTEVLKKLERDYGDTVRCIELGVDQMNVQAQALYERMGYAITQVLDNVGFYVMQKSLPTIPLDSAS